MPESTHESLLLVTVLALGLGLLFFLVSVRLFRRSRRDVFWRRRREAGQRGWRFLLLSGVLMSLSAVSCVLTVLATVVIDNEESTSTPQLVAASTENITFLPTDTNTARLSPVATTLSPPLIETPTQVATVIVVVTTTLVFEPTQTPFTTFTPQVTPLVSSVTPDPDAQLVITALDDQISDTLTPVNPRTDFAASTTRIYFFVEFDHMRPGALWQRALYRDGELLDSSSYLWGSETDGETYFFFGSDNGFPPGDYEIRVYIGENSEPASVKPFSVND